MTEQLKVTGSEDPVDMFLIEAMIHEDGKGVYTYIPDLRTGGNTEVELHFTINGKEAPLIPVLRGFFDRMVSHIDQEAERRAMKLIGAARMDEVKSAMDDLEYKLRDALEKAAWRIDGHLQSLESTNG